MQPWTGGPPSYARARDVAFFSRGRTVFAHSAARTQPYCRTGTRPIRPAPGFRIMDVDGRLTSRGARSASREKQHRRVRLGPSGPVVDADPLRGPDVLAVRLGPADGRCERSALGV